MLHHELDRISTKHEVYILTPRKTEEKLIKAKDYTNNSKLIIANDGKNSL